MVVQLADPLQGGFEFAVVAEPLLDHGFLFGAEADLLGASTGIADGEDPDEVAFAGGAGGAAGAMADAAAEQGSPKDFGSGGEGRESAILARLAGTADEFIYTSETYNGRAVKSRENIFDNFV